MYPIKPLTWKPGRISDIKLFDQGKYDQKQHHCKNKPNGVQYCVISLIHLTQTSSNFKVYFFEKENLLCFFYISVILIVIFQLWNTFFNIHTKATVFSLSHSNHCLDLPECILSLPHLLFTVTITATATTKSKHYQFPT